MVLHRRSSPLSACIPSDPIDSHHTCCCSLLQDFDTGLRGGLGGRGRRPRAADWDIGQLLAGSSRAATRGGGSAARDGELCFHAIVAIGGACLASSTHRVCLCQVVCCLAVAAVRAARIPPVRAATTAPAATNADAAPPRNNNERGQGWEDSHSRSDHSGVRQRGRVTPGTRMSLTVPRPVIPVASADSRCTPDTAFLLSVPSSLQMTPTSWTSLSSSRAAAVASAARRRRRRRS